MGLSKNEIRQKYDAFARKYDILESLILEPLGLNMLRRNLFSRISGNVLETAVGTGVNFKHYPNGCRVSAIDMSSAMIARAKIRAAKSGLDVDFHVMDVENLEFEDNSFDTVVDSLSLCTFSAPLKALAEMKRVCKPSGTILLLEHGRSRYENVGKLQDRWANGHSKALGCYWNREPLDLIRQSGLNIKTYRRYLAGILYTFEIPVL